MEIIQCDNNQFAANPQIDEICNRHNLVFGEDNQNRISRMTIGVVSAGGLGSVIIEQLKRLFPHKIILIDNDYVETTNLNRLENSKLIDAKLKTKKTKLAIQSILEFNPRQKLKAIHGDFLLKENQELFKECDFIFGASDSNAVRVATNHLCLVHGIPYLDCGVGAIVKSGNLKSAGGQVIRIYPDSGFCLHCSGMFNPKEAMNEFLSEKERNRLKNMGYIRGTKIQAPQVYSLNMIVASWAVWLFMRLVTGEKIDIDGIAINARDFKTYSWKEPAKNINDCPTCGFGGFIFSGDDVDLLCKEENSSKLKRDPLSSKERIEINFDIWAKECSTQFYRNLITGENTINPSDFRYFF